MNEIDLRRLAARACPTPSLDAWPACEVLADVLVEIGRFSPIVPGGAHAWAHDFFEREAIEIRRADRLIREAILQRMAMNPAHATVESVRGMCHHILMNYIGHKMTEATRLQIEAAVRDVVPAGLRVELREVRAENRYVLVVGDPGRSECFQVP